MAETSCYEEIENIKKYNKFMMGIYIFRIEKKVPQLKNK